MGEFHHDHRNQQYSITALTDSAGTIKERYAYSAYGEPTITDAAGTVLTSSAENNRYTYTGREWDDVAELYHYRARAYDPLSGRFCSRDPIGYEDGQNLYATHFALDGLDPSGLKLKINLKSLPAIAIQTRHPGAGGWTDINGPWSTAGKVTEWKVSDCCFCAMVTTPLKFNLTIESVTPSDGLMTHWTSRGFSDIVQHEAKRVSVYKAAYHAYLEAVEKSSRECGVVCSATEGDATNSLKAWMNKDLRLAAMRQFRDYDFGEQRRINQENEIANRRILVWGGHGPLGTGGVPLFDGYYRKVTPKPPGKLDPPRCPPSGNCS